jgi:hypothetical protein
MQELMAVQRWTEDAVSHLKVNSGRMEKRLEGMWWAFMNYIKTGSATPDFISDRRITFK